MKKATRPEEQSRPRKADATTEGPSKIARILAYLLTGASLTRARRHHSSFPRSWRQGGKPQRLVCPVSGWHRIGCLRKLEGWRLPYLEQPQASRSAGGATGRPTH